MRRIIGLIILLVFALNTHRSLASDSLASVGEDDKSLPLFQKMTVLNLNGCNIDDEAALLLAKGLQTNKSITQVTLTNNPITDISGVELVVTFKTMSSLQTISFAQTHISDQTAESLGTNLREMPDVRRVFIGQTDIKEKGYISLFKLLMNSSNQLYLNISDTPLTANALGSLNNLMQTNKDFTADVTFQTIPEADFKNFLKASLKSGTSNK